MIFFFGLLGEKGSIENFVFVSVCSGRRRDDVAVVVIIVEAVGVRGETGVAPARPHFRVGDE